MISKAWGENGQGLNDVWCHCLISFSPFKAFSCLWTATQNVKAYEKFPPRIRESTCYKEHFKYFFKSMTERVKLIKKQC